MKVILVGQYFLTPALFSNCIEVLLDILTAAFRADIYTANQEPRIDDSEMEELICKYEALF